MINQIIKDWISQIIKDRIDEITEYTIKSSGATAKDEYILKMNTFFILQDLTSRIPQLTERIIEIINTVEVKENPPFSANSEIREKAKIINTYLMPAVKEAIINTLKGGRE